MKTLTYLPVIFFVGVMLWAAPPTLFAQKTTPQKSTSIISKKIGVKSGYINYKVKSTGSPDSDYSLYFDDYGATTCQESYLVSYHGSSETKAEASSEVNLTDSTTAKSTANIETKQGSSTESRSQQLTIVKNGVQYTINMGDKTGYKTRVKADNEEINFLTADAAFLKQNNIANLGEEAVLDKPCVKYQKTDLKTGLKTTYWVWQGIPLKTTMQLNAFTLEVEAVIVDVSTPLTANRFQIPATIKFGQ